MWNMFAYVNVQYICKCENYFKKYCANICVFHIYFVPLQAILMVYVMSERERIEQVIQSLGLTARQFAVEIHVQPGTISNMMSGRNNPSYEVIKRIMQRYPTLNPEWLVVGNGEMWRTVPGQEAGLFDGLAPEGKAKNVATVASAQKEEPQITAAPSKQITRIVVYYSDNTFEEFTTKPLTH